MADPEDVARERMRRKLRRRGWGEAKIARWLEQKHLVEAREGRLHPPQPWADETDAQKEEQLLAKHHLYEGEHVDPSTALAIIDDAEKAGLVVLPGALAIVGEHSINELWSGGYSDWWSKLAHESYERGGKAESVSTVAQAFREFIRDGFPDGANAISFFVYR